MLYYNHRRGRKTPQTRKGAKMYEDFENEFLTEDDLLDAEYWREAQREDPSWDYGPQWDEE